jgi:hypothetical protein
MSLRKIKAISRKPTKTGKIQVGVLFEDMGDVWANSLDVERTANWEKGQMVNAEVVENGKYMNFNVVGEVAPSIQKTVSINNQEKDDKRDENIAWMNAKINATILIANGKVNIDLGLIETLGSVARDIYLLEKPTKEKPNKFEFSQKEELPIKQVENDEISIDEIPF